MNTSKRLSFGGCCAAAMLVWAVASPLVGQPLNRTNLTPKESVFAELNDSRFLDRQAEWGTRCKTPDPNCAPLVILDWDCRNLPNPNPNETPEQCVARKFKVYQQLAEAEQIEVFCDRAVAGQDSRQEIRVVHCRCLQIRPAAVSLASRLSRSKGLTT